MDQVARITQAIRDIPDFPKPGVIFKDITPVLADGELFRELIEFFAEELAPGSCDCVAGIDARGFIIGGALALRLGVGFVPIRKKGKLPFDCISEDYTLEYGTGTLEMHRDAVKPGQRVLLIDDLLATGGSAAAAVRMLRTLGAEVVGIRFLMELEFLHGRDALTGYSVRSLVRVQR